MVLRSLMRSNTIDGMKKKLLTKITNKKALVKALLRADDSCTYAISEICEVQRILDQLARVIEKDL